MRRLARTLWLASAVVAAACNGGGPSVSSATRPNVLPESNSTSGSPIKHVVLLVQENRSFNNLFATFPGATGTTVGKELVNGRTKRIKLAEKPLEDSRDLIHEYSGFLTAYNGGKMNGFNLIRRGAKRPAEGVAPYEYVQPSDLVPYWTLASTYALANAMFATQGSESFPAHQDLIRGGTFIDSTHSLIDDVPNIDEKWGCDSPNGSKTSLITTQLKLEARAGPFPCSDDFPSSGSNYLTLRDSFDGASPAISWKYYTPALGDPGGIWSAFDVIYPVRHGPEWTANVISPPSNVLTDISDGKLSQMSWVIPDGVDSDHPGAGADYGPSWVASVVNAIGESQYWSSTAIIVVWDDWGGFYDPVVPLCASGLRCRDDQGGPGLRVPLLVISPYTSLNQSSQPGYISNEVYSFGSIVRFIEDTFALKRLGTTDETTNSIGPESGSQGGDMLNFNQPPRQFQSIGSKYSRSFFLHQKPSRIPPDTQ
ncbi:MAG TPA: alkaline phosphatase family protein [Candidatus Cybelea sp.]|nr:alkaline phosphatase family protein [Candidatus Cybelea sp.]